MKSKDVKRKKGSKRLDSDKLSLAPLGFEAAIRAAMQTGKAPPAPTKGNKTKPKAIKR